MGQKLAGYNAAGRVTAFYDTEDSPPPDGASVVAVSDGDWMELLSGETAGRVIEVDESGSIFLREPPPPTVDELSSAALTQRDSLLSVAALRIGPLQDAADLLVATEAETESLSAWKQYRIALNRIEQQADFPQVIDWPQPPS